MHLLPQRLSGFYKCNPSEIFCVEDTNILLIAVPLSWVSLTSYPASYNSSCVHFHFYLETLPDLPDELIIPHSKPIEPAKPSVSSEIPHGGLHCTMTTFLFTQQAVCGPQKKGFGPICLITCIAQLSDHKNMT